MTLKTNSKTRFSISVSIFCLTSSLFGAPENKISTAVALQAARSNTNVLSNLLDTHKVCTFNNNMPEAIELLDLGNISTRDPEFPDRVARNFSCKIDNVEILPRQKKMIPVSQDKYEFSCSMKPGTLALMVVSHKEIGFLKSTLLKVLNTIPIHMRYTCRLVEYGQQFIANLIFGQPAFHGVESAVKCIGFKDISFGLTGIYLNLPEVTDC